MSRFYAHLKKKLGPEFAQRASVLGLCKGIIFDKNATISVKKYLEVLKTLAKVGHGDLSVRFNSSTGKLSIELGKIRTSNNFFDSISTMNSKLIDNTSEIYSTTLSIAHSIIPIKGIIFDSDTPERGLESESSACDASIDHGPEILKHLERASCDEYDDYLPRHPKPREIGHRRGDSLFNSDTSLVEAADEDGSGGGMASLVKLALAR